MRPDSLVGLLPMAISMPDQMVHSLAAQFEPPLGPDCMQLAGGCNRFEPDFPLRDSQTKPKKNVKQSERKVCSDCQHFQKRAIVTH